MNVSHKVEAFRIKHVLDLIFDTKHAEWKALGRYWLGIRLKAMNDIKNFVGGAPLRKLQISFIKNALKCLSNFKKLSKIKIWKSTFQH